MKWFVQEAAAGFRYAVIASARRDGEGTLLAVTITTSGRRPGPRRAGPTAPRCERCGAAMRRCSSRTRHGGGSFGEVAGGTARV